MNDAEDPLPPVPARRPPATDRNAARAEALRANLLRRKTQARGRSEKQAEMPTDD